MRATETVRSLLDWSETVFPESFPYAATLDAVRHRGKHFVDRSVLEALKHARERFGSSDKGERSRFLAKFLDITLDKADVKYDYLTYTALPILEHCRPELAEDAKPSRMLYLHDVSVCSIIAELSRFELGSLEGRDSYLPQMLPSADLVEKRLRFALRSIEAPLTRLGFAHEDQEDTYLQTLERALEFIAVHPLSHSRFILNVSMMPVYVVHDEHLFIRILQALDTTFLSAVGMLQGAIRAFENAPEAISGFIVCARDILTESLRHLQTLLTMQKESFKAFREFTTGASAIQSKNYKLMESLCRSPDKDRLESLAYSSVPAVQEEIRRGTVCLDDKLCELRGKKNIPAEIVRGVETAMTGLSEAITKFKYSHYGIAKKYLGDSSGTGYSEGMPYLKVVKDIPVFTAI